MAITQRPPNTIHLGGQIDRIGEYVASTAITPGMLVERFRDSDGKSKWRPHSTAADQQQAFVALESLMTNRGVDDAYAADDILTVAAYNRGGTFWGIIPSGQNIVTGAPLQSNGDGRLKAAAATTAAANVFRFKALDSPGAVTADTRVRVEVI